MKFQVDHCEEEIKGDEEFFTIRDRKAGDCDRKMVKKFREIIAVCCKRSPSRRPVMNEVATSTVYIYVLVNIHRIHTTLHITYIHTTLHILWKVIAMWESIAQSEGSKSENRKVPITIVL